MEIICTERTESTYRPMFAKADIGIISAVVSFPEHGVEMGLSHRDDDPEGMWLADWRFDNGLPVFSHGLGARECSKQIAGPEIVQAIEDFKFV